MFTLSIENTRRSLQVLLLTVAFTLASSALASTNCDQPTDPFANLYSLENHMSTLFLHVGNVPTVPNSQSNPNNAPQPNPGGGGPACTTGTWVESKQGTCWRVNAIWFAEGACQAGVVIVSARSKRAAIALLNGCRLLSTWSENERYSCTLVRECQWHPRRNSSTGKTDCIKSCSDWVER
jgi:hypothetical protein